MTVCIDMFNHFSTVLVRLT